MKRILQAVILRRVVTSWFLLYSLTAAAQVSGVKTIPGDYPTIGAGIADIVSAGLSGHVVLELQAGYYWHNEFYPLVIPENIATSPNATLTIRPAANATDVAVGTGYLGGGPMPTGDIPIFKIYGSYINIDGRPGGAGTSRVLTIWSQANNGSAIQFTNNASYNTVTYCNLVGVNDRAANPLYPQGIVTFRAEGPFPVNTSGWGTRENTIANCLFDGAIIWKPSHAIYAYGNVDAPHIGNKIINNEIRNFTYAGIDIKPDGPGSSWTISGNSFYSTSSESLYAEYGINLFHAGTTSGTNRIEGNYIGGSGPQASGKWLGGTKFGIVCGTYSGCVSSSVRNNVIKNMEFIEQDSDPAISNYAVFAGISVTNSGSPGELICSGNIIGGYAPDFGISVSAPGHSKNANVYGVLYTNCSRGSLTQNVIRNIRMSSVLESQFVGFKTNVINNVTISQNTVENLDIQSSGDVEILAFFDEYDHHTLAPCEPATAQPPVFDHNLVNSILATAQTGDADFTGLRISERIALNTGNIIGSASQANSIAVTGHTASVKGIVVAGTPENVSIADDVIANLTASAVLDASVYGIYFNGVGTAKFSGNQIHHLTAPVAKGIFIDPLAGASAVTAVKNTITGVNTSFGAGIETKIPPSGSLNVVATDNTISNWQNGFFTTGVSGATVTQVVQNNFVTGNQAGFNNQTATPQNATCNWWGDASGPSGSGPGTGDPVGPNVIFSPWATIPTFVSVDAGPDQTIYFGAGTNQRTLTATAVSCGTPSYLWSTGATTPTITVAPVFTTTYSVTVTDANGHTATDQVTITVKDIRCGNGKVKVCHKDRKTNKKQTLCIGLVDLIIHLAHGDSLGECTGTTSAASIKTGEIISDPAAGAFVIQAYPNPSSQHFRVAIRSSNSKERILMQVIDQYGRVIETRNNVIAGELLRIGDNYSPGIYFIRAVQGKEHKELKLVRLPG